MESETKSAASESPKNVVFDARQNLWESPKPALRTENLRNDPGAHAQL